MPSKPRRNLLDDQCRKLGLTSDEATQMARRAMSSYVAGAMVMPYGSFLEDAEARLYDIDVLSHIYTASFEQVAHRLVTLRRKGAEGVPFGFLRAEPAGRLTKRFPLPGLIFPGSGHGCPLWPIYSAFGSDSVVRQIAEFPNTARYLLVAKSVAKRVSGLSGAPSRFLDHAGMRHPARGPDRLWAGPRSVGALQPRAGRALLPPVHPPGLPAPTGRRAFWRCRSRSTRRWLRVRS